MISGEKMELTNKKTTEKWFSELWSKGNLSVADKIIDESYNPEWIQIDKTGPEQVKHEVKYFRSIFPDLKYEIEDLVISEIKVWAKYRAQGTQTGTAWGFEPSNNAVSFDGAVILTFNKEGRIVDRWGAFCFYDILVDLGLTPSLWEMSEVLNH